MAKPFSTLRQRMSPEAQRKASERTRVLIEEMKLDEIRRARELTQQELAKYSILARRPFRKSNIKQICM